VRLPWGRSPTTASWKWRDLSRFLNDTLTNIDCHHPDRRRPDADAERHRSSAAPSPYAPLDVTGASKIAAMLMLDHGNRDGRRGA